MPSEWNSLQMAQRIVNASIIMSVFASQAATGLLDESLPLGLQWKKPS